MILQALKYYSIRIWLTVGVGGFLSLWFLPMFQATLGTQATLPVVLLVCLVVLALFNYAVHRYAHFYTQSLINEATSWERSGFIGESEKAYQKAAALFDSFLYSPIGLKKKSRPLLRKMARFNLAKVEKDSQTEAFLIDYFQEHPEDEEALRTWLQQLIAKAPLAREYHDVTSIISERYSQNTFIQSLLAHLFIICRRTDFTALQTYRRYLNQEQRHNSNFIRKLAKIFLNEGRADEWALEIYLNAVAIDPENKQKLLKGLAACVSWMPINPTNRLLLDKARGYLTGIDDNTLAKMYRGFHLPTARGHRARPQRFRSMLQKAGHLLSHLTIVVYESSQAVITQCGKLPHRLPKRIISPVFLKWLGIAVPLVVSGVILFNIFTYLNVTSPSSTDIVIHPPSTAISIPKEEPKRFTLQVAAYLKREHAVRYVQALKKKQIVAYYIETQGVNKKWYQVRLRGFGAKQEAREYGNKLKSSGIIDDFYITNYKR